MSRPKLFSEMTEEERVEWAKTFEQPSGIKRPARAVATTKRDKAYKRAVNNASRRKDYYNPEKRKISWGDDYNARIRYLYQYNETFRELKKYRVYIRLFRNKRNEYDSWRRKYENYYKNNLVDYASIFKLEGTENYVHGFTLNDLAKVSPAKKALLTIFLTQHVLPAPTYRGYKYKETKLSNTVEEFYLLNEIAAYLRIFYKYRAKFDKVHKPDQKLYLKKQFWTEMIKARKEFDDNE